MMYWYDHDMGWWGYAGVVTLAVFWVLVIGVVAALLRYLLTDLPKQRRPSPGFTSPADVLAARYARGEITETEYRNRLSVLHDYGLR